MGLQWVGLQFVGGFPGEFGVVFFVEYVGIGKVSVCSRGMSHGDHGCGGSGKLWKVKWRRVRWQRGEMGVVVTWKR